MRTVSELIFSALGKPEVSGLKREKKKDICCVCGVYQGDIQKKDAFGSVYTNFDRLQGSSDTVCDCCYVMLKERRLRISSWIVTENKLYCYKREELEHVIFLDIETPFCCYITTSFKKLGQVKVKLNCSSQAFFIQFEETPVWFVPESVKDVYKIMKKQYSILPGEDGKETPKTYFTKQEIRSGDYSYKRIIEYGIEELREDNVELSKFRGGSVFELLLYVLNKGERLGKRSEPKQALSGGGSDNGGVEVDGLGQYRFF